MSAHSPTNTAADAVRAAPLYTPAVTGQIAEFTRLMEREGWSMRTAGRRLGCTQTVVSKLLSKSYTCPEKWMGRMAQVIRMENLRRQAPRGSKYVKTSVAERVTRLLSMAHVEGVLVMILGSTGVGKSIAVREYLAREPEAIYIVAGPGMTLQPLLDKLSAHVGVHATGVMLHRRDLVVEALLGTARLIILDEADYMHEAALQTMRIIQEEAGVGVALIGTPAFLQKLRERNSPTLDQVLGRVAYCDTIDACPEEDLREIAGQWPFGQEAVGALVAGAGGSARRLVAAALVALRREDKTVRQIGQRDVGQAYDALMPVSLNGKE